MRSRAIRAQVAGHRLTLRPEDVRSALERVEPGPIRDHFVVVGRRRYPVKQALAAVTGIDPADFTSQHARSVLRRLGLGLGRLSGDPVSPPGGVAHRQAGKQAMSSRAQPPGRGPTDTDAGEVLRPYLNRWVAWQRGDVLADGDSFGEVLAWLRAHRVTADAVFLVPDDPGRISAGLSG